MTLRQRYDGILAWFAEHMPVAESELHYENPYQLLVAGGEVPTDLDQMQRLPGVGRKTANVLGAVLWQREVMPVDTHVFRVSNRIGLTTNSKTPLQTELTLEKHIPGHLLPIAHHWLILHGRYVCTARAPQCDTCGIAPWCRKYASDHRTEKR